MIDDLRISLNSSVQFSHQLIAGIEALTNITRFRIDYLSQILSTLEILCQNLSSSYTESQINEIEKIIKAKLSNLLKCSLSSESHAKILDFLARVGGTEAKVEVIFLFFEMMMFISDSQVCAQTISGIQAKINSK